jgi:hypothetical protein
MGSRALRMFCGAIGGALLGLLVSGVLAVGVMCLYTTFVPDRTGYGLLSQPPTWFLATVVLVVVAGGLSGAVLGARWGSGSEIRGGDDTEDVEF